MTSRLILISRNKNFPTLSGARSDRPALPDAPRSIVLPCVGRGASFPRAVTSSPARNLARSFSDRAPSFDATAGRWIVPPSTVTVDAVASTESRCQDEHTRLEFSAPPGGAPCPTTCPPGDLLSTIQDVVSLISGVIVFGGIAFFCLVLA